MTDKQIIRARWIIPVVPQAQVIEDGIVVLSQGRIEAIGPASDFPGVTPDQHLEQHLLIPGLVNAHTHLAMTLMRGVADDLPLMTWLQEHIWPLEGQMVNAEYCHDGALLGLAESLYSGVTCVNDMYFHPQATVAALDQLGMRGRVGMIVLDFPTPYADGPEAYLARGRELHDSLQGHPRVATMFAPHAPYTVGDDSLQRIRALADELGVRVHMHVHETAHEVSEAQSQSGHRPLARLQDLGLVNEMLTAVHCTQLEPAEIALLAQAGASVVHCPESNLKLASGFCPTAALSEAGVNMALGTDGAASNNDLDLLGEMRTAALLAKGVAQRADALPAFQALEMATIGGAQALGMEDQVGSLEPGKAADMVALRCDALISQPIFDPLSHLVYGAQRSQISQVWIAGQTRVSHGEIHGFDTSQMHATIAEWQQRMRHANA
jgi:5-methylthioadenosine/S-adenosylhomocysteine deaminase